MQKIFSVEDGTACGYYRIRLPFDEMAKHGVDVEYKSIVAPVPDDVIFVGQRIGYPGFRTNWLRLWRTHKMVWETDDDLWCLDPSNERAVKAYTPELLHELAEIVRTAHVVTVSTEPLREAMLKFNPNVVVLPNHIDGRMFDLERPRRPRLTVGWAGGDSHRKFTRGGTSHCHADRTKYFRSRRRCPQLVERGLPYCDWRSLGSCDSYLNFYHRPLHDLCVRCRVFRNRF